jgi:DNA-binding NarL/FixJ family response regulator
MIRVAIADDHPELQLALRLLLNSSSNMDLVCEASNGLEAVACVERHRPDVLVMDVTMPELNGFAAAKQIADLSVTTRIILISAHKSRSVSKRAAAMGIHGFVPKGELVKSLLTAIETVHEGKQYFRE